MSDTPSDGGPAFPVPHLVTIHGEVVNFGAAGGMTLRDYFAAKVMGGITANSSTQAGSGVTEGAAAAALARFAYLVADAMIAARAGGAA